MHILEYRIKKTQDGNIKMCLNSKNGHKKNAQLSGINFLSDKKNIYWINST